MGGVGWVGWGHRQHSLLHIYVMMKIIMMMGNTLVIESGRQAQVPTVVPAELSWPLLADQYTD